MRNRASGNLEILRCTCTSKFDAEPVVGPAQAGPVRRRKEKRRTAPFASGICHRYHAVRLRLRSQATPPQATLGVRLRELRWKNKAWLATAETIAGWNGFEIRNAGSGRSPVRKRSG